MNKRVSSFLAALALACIAAPAAAVTFGTPDGNGHPFVGTLLFQRPDGFFSCTGTMMSPTVMLTAGHCTEESGQANLNTWVSFAPTIQFRTGCNGDLKCLVRYFDNPKNGWIKGTAYAHPQYDDFNQFPATFDVGVIKLSTPVSMPVYGELPSLGFLETIRTAAENKFTVVGYGLQGLIQPFASDLWERWVGSVKLIELNSTWDGGHSAKYTNNPGSDGGTCFGDSGGAGLRGVVPA